MVVKGNEYIMKLKVVDINEHLNHLVQYYNKSSHDQCVGTSNQRPLRRPPVAIFRNLFFSSTAFEHLYLLLISIVRQEYCTFMHCIENNRDTFYFTFLE